MACSVFDGRTVTDAAREGKGRRGAGGGGRAADLSANISLLQPVVTHFQVRKRRVQGAAEAGGVRGTDGIRWG